MMTTRARNAALIAMLSSACLYADTPEWPLIKNIDVATGMNWKAARQFLNVALVDSSNEVRYRLICRGGSDKYLDDLQARIDINYVGPLMCVLNDGDRETEVSLLRESPVPPWFTRGRFATSDLLGDCANYPEFGRVRHFRLRGFMLTLTVSDPVIDGKDLEYLTFSVSVRQDPLAKLPIAEPVTLPDPRGVKNGCTERQEQIPAKSGH